MQKEASLDKIGGINRDIVNHEGTKEHEVIGKTDSSILSICLRGSSRSASLRAG